MLNWKQKQKKQGKLFKDLYKEQTSTKGKIQKNVILEKITTTLDKKKN